MQRWMIALALSTIPAAAAPAWAWHDEGHVYAARAAVQSLPADVPTFFVEGVDTIAHAALDPDVIRNRALPQLRDADAPEHYIDLEFLQGRPLPPTRHGLIALCHELGVEPAKVGTLPYAIAERAQWLTVAFAEHRRWPDNPHVQAKILVLAGILAHYTADLAMPLHTTIHFDGRVARAPESETGDSSMQSYLLDAPKLHRGIHARVDALPTKIPYAEIFPEPVEGVAAHDNVFELTVTNLMRSHALADRVYDLEPQIPAMPDLELASDEVRAFTIERMHHAAQFTASIYLSAWRNSETLRLPHWLDRRVFDETFDPTTIPPQPGP